MKILLVEDDSDIGALLARGFSAEGFSVSLAPDGRAALEAAETLKPDAAVLDVMLGDMSGVEICKALREGGMEGPIIMLSALSSVPDRARGLDAGADDYMVKPFEFAELLARLETHRQRRKSGASPPLTSGQAQKGCIGKLVYDPDTREARAGDSIARFTEREAELFLLLAQNVGRPLSRADIFNRLWAGHGGASENVVDVYIGYLRRKLPAEAVAGAALRTVRGRGFMLSESPEAEN